jgi:methionyl-tRNA formyltransferase
MQMDAGLDTGAMLLKKTLPIVSTDTAGSLHDPLAEMGASAIVEAISQLASLTPEPQRDTLATYAAKVSKEEARLDWQQDAQTLLRQVRAYNPFPGAFTTLHAETLKIWHGESAPRTSGQAGEIMQVDRSGIVVACHHGAIRLLELQAAGSKRMCVDAFVAGRTLHAGDRLGGL